MRELSITECAQVAGGDDDIDMSWNDLCDNWDTLADGFDLSGFEGDLDGWFESDDTGDFGSGPLGSDSTGLGGGGGHRPSVRPRRSAPSGGRVKVTKKPSISVMKLLGIDIGGQCKVTVTCTATGSTH